MSKSRHALIEPITTIAPGVAIYKTAASPFWQVRVRNRILKKYEVRSTKETGKVDARKAALEIATGLYGLTPAPPREFTFKTYALKFLEQCRQHIEKGTRNANYVRSMRLFVENPKWGLLNYFGGMDVRQVKTKNFLEYRRDLHKRYPEFKPSTHNSIQASFRNVMKVARDEGTIDVVPETPRTEQQDSPRAFFRFFPLVSKHDDEYRRLRAVALEMASSAESVRGVPITGELYDLIMFTVHSFVRPSSTELYCLQHKHVTVAEHPKRLIVTIADGKTGFRQANTMPGAVSAYQRICRRHPNAGKDDYLFFPKYKNRTTAQNIIQRQFNEIVLRSGLKIDPVTGTSRTIYCLRHTAFCLRLIKSEGQVNIYNLAKNAGTSVDQLERFYTRNLPLSAEMARNLQIMVARNSASS
ncbi:hypothetical protein [Asticcacaulis taihuensis]|uniref:hypothetical protein n=1 Tax=Asticcacaulis taihuensis TaxID=260084 RepID=UPI0026F0A7E8|nr:hypothetical protein [Asticcacaulis taihuensis]